MLRPTTVPVSVVFPSGLLGISEEQKNSRHIEMCALGFEPKLFQPENDSENGYSSGTALERALLLSQALTDRKSNLLWAARGGFGASETIPFLEKLLPPVLPQKTLIGFSDVSFLGNYLFQRYPNFQYIHANNYFDPKLLKSGSEWERNTLMSLARCEAPSEITLPLEWSQGYGAQGVTQRQIQGACIPLNLALGAVLACVKNFCIPQTNIMFLEDVNEATYRLLRLSDQMLLGELFKNTQAIVLGEFQNCFTEPNENIQHFGMLLSKKLHLPVFGLEVFGHGKNRLPLLTGAKVCIDGVAEGHKIRISYVSDRHAEGVCQVAPAKVQNNLKIHFVGIGGTGMASVAGLAKAKGHRVSGSDNPIYPPMDQTLREIQITPDVGFQAENLSKSNPDAVVLANVISRRNAELKPNLEFDALTQSNIPVFSFPSFLRQHFLINANNIVVAGTHGKTTTTSLIAHLLAEDGLEPSFMVGGRPKNFGVGFNLKNQKLFVLEGDEYDSALFDKGPKFLHYEPSVALINNIEFDHADIYQNVEAIQKEFARYAQICAARNGVLVANFNCARTRQIALSAKSNPTVLCLNFGDVSLLDPSFHQDLDWSLQSFNPNVLGAKIEVKTPWGDIHSAQLSMFGPHNALNAVAALACAHGREIFDSKKGILSTHEFQKIIADKKSFSHFDSYLKSLQTFRGVERRFEFIGAKNDVFIYDDFAHHPTAIDTTLRAFKDHLVATNSKGRLVACFDPRNATMRRSVLQQELIESFSNADLVRFGKLPIDKRLAREELLDIKTVSARIGPKAKSFEDNSELLNCLKNELKEGDLVVFMSSGAFDDCPRTLLKNL